MPQLPQPFPLLTSQLYSNAAAGHGHVHQGGDGGYSPQAKGGGGQQRAAQLGQGAKRKASAESAQLPPAAAADDGTEGGDQTRVKRPMK